MAEENFAKSAGEIVSSALSGKAPEKPAKKVSGKRRAADWEPIKLAMKLSELTENWRAVAGEPLASRSAPASCEEADGSLLVTVNVPNQMVLASARFRKMRLERAISNFFGGEAICVEFKVGTIHRQPAAAQPRAVKRAPIINGAEEIAEREKFFLESGMSPELAASMARVMLSLEKLSKRRGSNSRKN